MPEQRRGILIAPSQERIERVEEQLRETLTETAVDDGIASRPEQITVRDLLPQADLQSGADNGWDGNDAQWEQTSMTNTGAQTANVTYDIDSSARAENKVIGIMVISNTAGTPVTTQIEFRTGTGAPIEQLQVEGLLTDEETMGLMADPIIYGAKQDGAIAQWADGTDDLVVFHGAVAEQIGNTFEPSSDFLSDRSDFDPTDVPSLD